MHTEPQTLEDEAAHDVDLTLRHVTHRFPDELALALLPDARTIGACTWLDTQVTSRERALKSSRSR